jgi:biotin operon repressor
MRPQILALARDPISASELARRLSHPRQRVNYHVRQLAREGFLKPASQQRKRNMVEQQYVASAHAYVLSPEVLGEAAPRVEATPDAASAAHLVGLCSQAQAEVARVMASANAAGVRLRTISLQNEIRFESVDQRTQFTAALTKAVSDIVTHYSSASQNVSGGAAAGRPFRLFLGCYPIPVSGT